MTARKTLSCVLTFFLSFMIAQAVQAGESETSGKAMMANAVLYAPDGGYVGMVEFEQTERGVKITAIIDSLPPGEHAFHLHESGECEPPDFKSAGGHFNPHGAEHGFLNPKGPHAGDLPNIVIGSDGTGSMEMITARVTLVPGEKHSLFGEGGTAVVIHIGPDDYLTDPAGMGGPRIACGIIEKVE
jgi:Cu-Zn family superoxide dismutase